MGHSWKLPGAKYGSIMGMIWQLYGQVKSILRHFLMLPFLGNVGLIHIWTISRYWPYMEKIWTKLNSIVSVVPFPDISHIWSKYGKTEKKPVLYHSQIMAIYGKNMGKTEQNSQCCTIPR